MLLICQNFNRYNYKVLFGYLNISICLFIKNGHLQMLPKFRKLQYVTIYFTMAISRGGFLFVFFSDRRFEKFQLV